MVADCQDFEFRDEERQQSVYRPALIETDGFSGFCMLRNLSSRGMKAEAYAQLEADQRVVIELSHILRVEGVIIWSDGSNVGVKFDHEIDVAAVLTGTEGGDQSGRSRPPRLSIGCTAKIATDQREISVSVSDVSQRGLKVNVSNVKVGEEMDVYLPQHPVKKAIVRWTDGSAAGLNFVAPMKYSELAAWAILVQEERLNGRANPLAGNLCLIRKAQRSK